MRGFANTIKRIQALRRRFETLLAAARAPADRAPEAPRATRLRELTDFGENPGDLRMFAYVPERLPRGAPLVVALHGCGQSAAAYEDGTGWSSLADRFGFALLYPEQQPANNPRNCFSWFVAGDIARDRGEARSIRAMVEHAVASLGVDRRRVFVTGLSAGGAMAAVMLATYPEAFAGGAIIAGLPYGCAGSVEQALETMFAAKPSSAQALGDRVRAASGHRGPWPKLSIWHGTADQIVTPGNAENIVRQWTNVHDVAAAPSYEESIGRHTRRVWTDADGEPLIEAFAIDGMGHGVPLAASPNDTKEQRCGAAGAFFLDAGISSTHRIARFWHLDEGAVEAAYARVTAPQPSRLPSDQRVPVAAAAHRRSDAGDASSDAEQNARRRYDPNVVIAAAFKAAGLPVPELPTGATSQVTPGPIIAAALKAAGLKAP